MVVQNLSYPVLLALAICLSITVVQNAYAVWPFPDPQPLPIFHGNNFDVVYKGDNIYTWTSKPERLPVGDQWIDFRYFDDTDHFTFESANGAITFSKNSCTLKMFQPGFVQTGETPVINSISNTLKEARVGTDTWEDSTVNAGVCQFSFEPAEHGVLVTTKKQGGILGMSTGFEQRYDIRNNGKIKITNVISNYDIVKQDFKFGFAQSFDGDFNIIVDGVEYNTATLDHEVFFDRNALEGKLIQIKKGNIEIDYDPQNYIHKYLWGFKISPHHANFDFTAGTEALTNAVLEIDPVFAYTSAQSQQYLQTAVTTQCNTVGPVGATNGTASTASYRVSKPSTGAGDNCVVELGKFIITSIPDSTTIISANFRHDHGATGSTNAIMLVARNTTVDPQGAGSAGSKYVQVTQGNFVISPWTEDVPGTNDIVQPFNSNGTTAIQNSLSQNWFGLGLSFVSMVSDGSAHSISDLQNWELEVTYTGPPRMYENKPMRYDNNTVIGSGWVYKKNATNTQILTINSTGWAKSTDVSDTFPYNYSAKDALDGFVDNKTINKRISANTAQQGRTNIFDVNCGGDSDTDWRVKFNFTNYHNLTYWTQPTCQNNGDITGMLRFIKLGTGPSTNQTTKGIARAVDTSEFSWCPSKLLVNGTQATYNCNTGNIVFNGTNIQVGNGYKSFRLGFTFFTDNVTSAPTGLSGTATSENAIALSWTAPTALHGDNVQSYRVWRDGSIIKNATSTNATSYSDTSAGPGGTTHTYQVCAWNRIGCSPYSSTASAQTFTPTTGTITVTGGNVGDVEQLNATVTITAGSPTPFTVSAVKIYKNGVLVQTNSTSFNISSVGGHYLSRNWYQMLTDTPNTFHIKMTVSNSTGTITLSSTNNVTVTREYDPDYFTATVPAQGQVNYTMSRSSGYDDINLSVNRDKGGNIFNIECIYQTPTQAASDVFNNTHRSGTWVNYSNVGYYNHTFSGAASSHYYITCFNDAELFSTVSYTNSSIVSLGVALFDNYLGGMLGVPVGIFFILLLAGLASPRTANIYIVIVLAAAAVMVQVGFFNLSPGIWALSLLGGIVGIFLKKLF